MTPDSAEIPGLIAKAWQSILDDWHVLITDPSTHPIRDLMTCTPNWDWLEQLGKPLLVMSSLQNARGHDMLVGFSSEIATTVTVKLGIWTSETHVPANQPTLFLGCTLAPIISCAVCTVELTCPVQHVSCIYAHLPRDARGAMALYPHHIDQGRFGGMCVAGPPLLPSTPSHSWPTSSWRDAAYRKKRLQDMYAEELMCKSCKPSRLPIVTNCKPARAKIRY